MTEKLAQALKQLRDVLQEETAHNCVCVDVFINSEGYDIGEMSLHTVYQVCDDEIYGPINMNMVLPPDNKYRPDPVDEVKQRALKAAQESLDALKGTDARTTHQEKIMATLKQLLDALHESTDLSSAKELKSACELIIEVQEMDASERDCIRAAYKHGPLFDGDVPSKGGRDQLLCNGYMAKVVVKGEDGYNACTHKGAWAYRLLEAGA